MFYRQLWLAFGVQRVRRMAPTTAENPKPESQEQVVLHEEIGHVRVVILNNPRKLNIISPDLVMELAKLYEKFERDNEVELIILKGAGRAFSAGGDLRVFYNGRAGDLCIEIVYRMYWLVYHLHTYKKTLVSLVHGFAIGGGACLAFLTTYSVVTEKTVFSMPEAAFGFHTDCSFSFVLSHLPGYLGEYLALTGARLSGEELIALGLATHFVPTERLSELEKKLIDMNSGDKNSVKATIEEFCLQVQPGEKSIMKRCPLIDKCFSKGTVEEIIEALSQESEAEGNEWVKDTIKTLKRSSPTGLKMTLQSIRLGRNQTAAESLKKEFRLTINTLRGIISEDMFEGIRAAIIEKDNSPKWGLSLEEITSEKLDLLFKPYEDQFELQLPVENPRWQGKYEESAYKK